MRCTAAASPAAHTRLPSASFKSRTEAPSASPGGAPGGSSHHSTLAPGCAGSARRPSGCATSTRTCTGVSSGTASSTCVMAGIAVSSPAMRYAGASRSTVYPRPGPEIAADTPGSADSAQSDATPPPWTTMPMSSSSASVSTRHGVSVLIVGRRPSGRRNSLPFQLGTTKSPPPGVGRSTRTLAAGSSTANPASSAPPRVTRTRRRVRRSTLRTSTWRNAGGSRRTRLVAVTDTRTQLCAAPASPIGSGRRTTARSRGCRGRRGTSCDSR